MKRRQSGQALVGVLVVTTLAFLMAGAVAVGASALLSQESNPQNGSSRDLAAQDALVAAVAAVAGRGNGGGSAPCSRISSTLTATLPSGYVSRALCIRADGVPAGPLKLAQLQWSGGCAVVDVTSYASNRLLLWFSAQGSPTAWVDTTQSGCRQAASFCSGAASGSVTQLFLNCDLDEEDGVGAHYLHIRNLSQSPNFVRLAAYDSAGGSIYALAASTGIARGPAYEEGDLWVSLDGATTTLRFEGAF